MRVRTLGVRALRVRTLGVGSLGVGSLATLRIILTQQDCKFLLSVDIVIKFLRYLIKVIVNYVVTLCLKSSDLIRSAVINGTTSITIDQSRGSERRTCVNINVVNNCNLLVGVTNFRILSWVAWGNRGWLTLNWTVTRNIWNWFVWRNLSWVVWISWILWRWGTLDWVTVLVNWNQAPSWLVNNHND